MTCSVHEALFANKPTKISVNGVAIAREAVAREAQHHPAAKPVEAWKEAARALVIRELLLQEARRLDIAAEPLRDDAGRRETDEEALIRAVVDREVVTPEPDEQTCRRYYAQNRRRFRSSDIYEAAHILIAARHDDAKAFAQARQQAAAIQAELAAHPQRFADLGRQYSVCPSAAQGGNLGQITKGDTTPEFEQALVALAPGEITSEPVATRYGVHIIRLDRKHDGRNLPYELVADRIADYLRDSVRRRATAQYIARLVSGASITGIELEGAEAHRVN